jgi:hypothetical protein
MEAVGVIGKTPAARPTQLQNALLQQKLKASRSDRMCRVGFRHSGMKPSDG